MTHDELRDYIDEFDAAGMVNEPAVRALRAVVGLHKPHDITLPNGDWGRDCIVCHGFTYPCPELLEIAKELGLEDA